jgi:DNA modification methylase
MIIWAKPNPMPESCTDRPTDAYEHILMLTKSERYFWDADAVREPSTGNAHHPGYGNGGPKAAQRETEGTFAKWRESTPERFPERNLRNVWAFPTQPYKGAHFATFPEEIPRRCILAATSARGACVDCGAPWQRMIKKKPMEIRRTDWGEQAGNRTATSGTMISPAESETIGWKPACKCFPGIETRPCLVLDPFGGSGTTGRVAVELSRRAVLLDLAYHDHAEKRTRQVQRRLPV